MKPRKINIFLSFSLFSRTTQLYTRIVFVLDNKQFIEMKENIIYFIAIQTFPL